MFELYRRHDAESRRTTRSQPAFEGIASPNWDNSGVMAVDDWTRSLQQANKLAFRLISKVSQYSCSANMDIRQSPEKVRHHELIRLTKRQNSIQGRISSSTYSLPQRPSIPLLF